MVDTAQDYVHEQVISRREKYISLSDRGKELYTQFINKSITLTRELITPQRKKPEVLTSGFLSIPTRIRTAVL